MGGGGMPPSHHPHHPHHAHHPNSHHHFAAHLSQSQVGLHHAAAAAVAAEHHPSTSAMYLTSQQALGSLGFHRQSLMETPSSSLHPYHPAHHHHHHINHQQTKQLAQQQLSVLIYRRTTLALLKKISIIKGFEFSKIVTRSRYFSGHDYREKKTLEIQNSDLIFNNSFKNSH